MLFLRRRAVSAPRGIGCGGLSGWRTLTANSHQFEEAAGGCFWFDPKMKLRVRPRDAGALVNREELFLHGWRPRGPHQGSPVRSGCGPPVARPRPAAHSTWVSGFLETIVSLTSKQRLLSSPPFPSPPSPAWDSTSQTGRTGMASNEWLAPEEEALGWERWEPQGLICPHSSSLIQVWAIRLQYSPSDFLSVPDSPRLKMRALPWAREAGGALGRVCGLFGWPRPLSATAVSQCGPCSQDGRGLSLPPKPWAQPLRSAI